MRVTLNEESDIPVCCLNCGWRGKRSELKEVQWSPEDDYLIKGETHEVCPSCESPAWEPE